MKTTYTLSLIVLSAGLLFGSDSRGDDHDDKAYLGGKPSIRVLGRSIDGLGARWYEHFFSFSEEDNPANQQGNIDCGAKNHGPIWFLNGTKTFGWDGLAFVEYHCEIKPRILFLPTFDIFFANFPGENFPVQLKRQIVKSVVDQVCVHEVTLDGEPLIYRAPVIRAQTRPFALNLPDGYASVGLPPGLPIDDDETVGDAHWLVIPPLPPGHHTLNYVVGGQCDADGVPQVGIDVTYNLTVVGHTD